MRRLGIAIITATLMALAGAAGAGIWIYAELETPYYGAGTAEVFVDIPRGASAGMITTLLTDAGILRHGLPFRIHLRRSGMGRHIQAGEYRFFKAATPKQIAQRLSQGDVFFHSVTVPEGLTAGETVSLLARSGLGNASELERAVRRTDWIRDLDPKAKTLEGYLFPDTYRFGRNTRSETIIKTMVRQFRKEFERISPRNSLDASPDISRTVILASMIEKEVKIPQEGPLVASVLVNRLEKKMPLAVDATIIYAMKLGGTYQGRLGKADLSMESPYNTYRRLGLPPGPICNPGAGALRAALNPARTDYYYYVSRNDGTHQFSKDFNAHINAVNLYQKPLAKKRR